MGCYSKEQKSPKSASLVANRALLATLLPLADHGLMRLVNALSAQALHTPQHPDRTKILKQAIIALLLEDPSVKGACKFPDSVWAHWLANSTRVWASIHVKLCQVMALGVSSLFPVNCEGCSE